MILKRAVKWYLPAALNSITFMSEHFINLGIAYLGA